MSVYRIYYNKDGAKMMRPVLSREDYIKMRGCENQRKAVAAVRSGDESQKKQLIQMNYSCLPNADGTLKGSTRMSTTIGMDIDHIPPEEMQAVKERILAKKDELGLRMLELSARAAGYHLVFSRRPYMSQEENLGWASKLLEVEYDQGAKDITRVFFTTTDSEEDLIYLDDEIFKTNTDLTDKTDNKTNTNLTNLTNPVNPKNPCSEKENSCHSSNSCSPEPLCFKGRPYSDIIAEYWRRTGGVPAEGERNVKLHKLAANLRAICDNRKDLLMQVMPRLGLSEQELQSIVDSACKEPTKGSKLIDRIIDACADPQPPNLGSSYPPAMPKRLPAIVRLLTSKTPDIYKPAVAHAIFPALGAHLWRVRFRYIDNVMHEATFMNVLMAGTGAGKDCISQPINHIMADIRQRDAENLKREADWKKEVNSKGSNKDKRQRPEGLVIQEVDPDMTNPAFVMRMAEADEHFLYTKMNEIDQFDALRGSARGSQQFQIMCLAFDPDNRYGQTRVGTQSVTEKVCIRFNWNAATTIQKGQKYFARVLTDGPISRINFCTIPEREIGADMPVYGTYDSSFDEELRPFIDRLCRAAGVIDCPQAFRLAKKLKDECAEFARLSQSRVYENLSFRANVIAYLKACVLYICNDYKWSKEIEDFVRWSLQYDLHCKMQFFGEAIANANRSADEQGTRRGPRNLLQLLPDEFSTHDADLVRQANGMDTRGTRNMLSQWVHRGYLLQMTDDSFKKLKIED